MDLLAIAHEGEPYGYLTIGGKSIDDKTLARMTGTTPQKVRKLLAELESHNVFSRNEKGIIYSRRMVRDERIRNVRAAAGKLGGNPDLLDKLKVNQQDNPPEEERISRKDKRNPTPSSSSSSSSSETTTTPPLGENPFLAELLKRVTEPTAWRAEIDAMLASMPGHWPASPEQIETAAREMIGNGHAKNPNMRQFKRYVEGAIKHAPVSNGKHNAGEQGYQNAKRALEGIE